MNNSLPKLDIIIVNWNGKAFLRECLKSIVGTHKDQFSLKSVIVVDNASTDESISTIQGIELPLKVIINDTNKGYAKACNQGAFGGTSDYILFLNPDIRLFEDSLDEPMRFMKGPEGTRVGVCGIQLVNDQTGILRSCSRLPTPGLFISSMLGLDRILPEVFKSHFMNEWDHKLNREVDQVLGAFFLMRRSVYERLGGFDERFFVYYEDVDFALRTKKEGLTSYYFANARAFHKGGGSSDQVKSRRLFYNLHSRILFVHKHFGVMKAACIMLGTISVELVSRLLQALFSGSFIKVREICFGYLMLYRSLFYIFDARGPRCND